MAEQPAACYIWAMPMSYDPKSPEMRRRRFRPIPVRERMIPQPGTFGNLGRNAYVGPSLAQFDLTLHKRVPVTERVNVEFRAEIYNLFNRANFTAPNGIRTSSAFGTITSTLDPRQLQLGAKVLW